MRGSHVVIAIGLAAGGLVSDPTAQTKYPLKVGPLQVDVAAGVATVVINHPPTNLLGGPLGGALGEVRDRLEADAAVRVVVFRSADRDFFIMHGDVEGLRRAPAGGPFDGRPNGAAASFERWNRSRLVSIAMIEGAARGGGAEFATALDLRYGSPRAVLGQPEVPLGILPGAGGTARLPRLLGRGRALEVILTGRDVAADEAAAIGWLDAVFPADDLENRVMQLARRIAAMPPDSVAAVKRVVAVSLGSLEAALSEETKALGELRAGGAHMEPMRRFLEAGGQTREGETKRMSEILDAVLQQPK
jgi:enoyl-CoA hydratase/carnithine racemase